MNSIGSFRQKASVIFQQFGLAPFRKILTSPDIERVANESGCSPQRGRVLVPEAVVWLMVGVALKTSSMTQGLSLAWGWICTACFWLKGPCITEEAFCQARQRLSLIFWRKLWDCLRFKYIQRFDAQMRWKGLRPIAVDGSEVDVPNVPALVKFFTRPRTQRGDSKSPQGRLVAACSVFTGFCLDFVFISRRFSEHLALKHLMRYFQENDLILLDRGFFFLRRHSCDSRAQGTLSHASNGTNRRPR